jgi:hypothetical protein
VLQNPKNIDDWIADGELALGGQLAATNDQLGRPQRFMRPLNKGSPPIARPMERTLRRMTFRLRGTL